MAPCAHLPLQFTQQRHPHPAILSPPPGQLVKQQQSGTCISFLSLYMYILSVDELHLFCVLAGLHTSRLTTAAFSPSTLKPRYLQAQRPPRRLQLIEIFCPLNPGADNTGSSRGVKVNKVKECIGI